MSDNPRKSGWHEELEEILRTEIADEEARTRALKALENTIREKDALIDGLLKTVESYSEAGKAVPDAGEG